MSTQGYFNENSASEIYLLENVRLQGRKTELRQLLKILNLSKNGQAKAVLVTGDAGIGKSALLGAFAAHARGRGDHVVALECNTIEPTPAGFLRSQLGQTVQLRYTPRLSFQADLSFDEAARINDILHNPRVAQDVAAEEEPGDTDDPDGAEDGSGGR